MVKIARCLLLRIGTAAPLCKANGGSACQRRVAGSTFVVVALRLTSQSAGLQSAL